MVTNQDDLHTMYVFSIRLDELVKNKYEYAKNFCMDCGISQGTYTQWINKTNMPTAIYLAKICRILDTSADYLLGLIDIPTIDKYDKITNLIKEYNNKIMEIVKN